MICIYTGDDSSFCTCSTCGAKRSSPIRFDDINDLLRQIRQRVTEPHRRRPLVIPESNCERGHSGLVECRGGCKPRPIAKAVVMEEPGWFQRALNRVRVWLGLQAIR